MTLALAAVANLAWLYFIFKYEGLKSIIVHIFGNKADKNEVGIYTFIGLIPIFFAVGIIEVISIYSDQFLSALDYSEMFTGKISCTNVHNSTRV